MVKIEREHVLGTPIYSVRAEVSLLANQGNQ